MSHDFWLRDRLYDFLGFEEKQISDYIKVATKRCKTIDEVK